MAEVEDPDDRPLCPRCSGRVLPVINGLPSEEALWAGRGRIHFGGCQALYWMSWICTYCGLQFGLSDEDRKRAHRVVERLIAEAGGTEAWARTKRGRFMTALEANPAPPPERRRWRRRRRTRG